MEKTTEKEGEWRKALEGLDRGIRRAGGKSTWEREREAQQQQKDDAEEAERRRKPGHADFNVRYQEGFRQVKEGIQNLLVSGNQGASPS